MKVNVPFAVQVGDNGITQNSQETLVNMYAEIVPSGRSRLIRRQRPGLSLKKALVGEKRCIEKFGSDHYCVVSNIFYKFDGTTLTNLGTLSTSTGRCWMICNDNAEIMISDGVNGYFWNGSTLSVITKPSGMTGFGTLAYMSGYGIIAVPDSDRFYYTPNSDFSQVNTLDYLSAESSPDKIVRVFVDHNELWVAGERTTEIWQPVSGSVPFQSVTNAVLSRGCGAAGSYVAEDNTLLFLGDDGIVYRVDGYRPAAVSNRVIEEKISSVPSSVRESAQAFVYTSNGNKFYTIRFKDYLTVQLNIATGLWNEVQSLNKNDFDVVGPAGHDSDFILTAKGISALDTSLNTDDGEIMIRSGTSAPAWANGNRVAVNFFQLVAEVGGIGVGETAEVMMRFAPDGVTFGNERKRTLGSTGEYVHRVIWRNLGFGRSPVIRFSVSDDVRFSIIDAVADLRYVA